MQIWIGDEIGRGVKRVTAPTILDHLGNISSHPLFSHRTHTPHLAALPHGITYTLAASAAPPTRPPSSTPETLSGVWHMRYGWYMQRRDSNAGPPKRGRAACSVQHRVANLAPTSCEWEGPGKRGGSLSQPPLARRRRYSVGVAWGGALSFPLWFSAAVLSIGGV